MRSIVTGRVSVIIVNYNGYEYAARCVAAVLQNNYPDYEVILADNGSTDGSAARLRDEFGARGVTVLALDKNYGPAYARNAAAELSSGEFLGFLDNDTVPDSDWLSAAIAAFDGDPRLGAVQCKLMLLRTPDRFDYVGDYLGSFGFIMQPVVAGDEDVGQANAQVPIFSAKSAGMVARSTAFREVGGFDPDYFIYVEETDLGLRLWLRGYTAAYVPGSRVLHEFGSSNVTDRLQHHRLARFHGTKNYVLTLLKSLEAGSLARILPIHVSLWLGFAALRMAKRDIRSALWILEGLAWNVTHLPTTLLKRKTIQRTRKLSDAEIMAVVGRKDSLTNMYKKATAVRSIGNYKPMNT